MVLGKGLLEEDGTGLYGELLDRILDEADIEADIRILPLKRSIQALSERDADCIWPLDIKLVGHLGYGRSDLIQSAMAFQSRQYVFVAPGDPRVDSLRDLKGKTVGILNGSSTQNELIEAGALPQLLKNQRSKLRMFLSGRLDAFVGWYPDIFVTLSNLEVKPDVLQAERHVIRVTDIRLVCRSTQEAERLFRTLNPAIAALADSSAFDEILARYGVPQLPLH